MYTTPSLRWSGTESNFIGTEEQTDYRSKVDLSGYDGEEA